MFTKLEEHLLDAQRIIAVSFLSMLLFSLPRFVESSLNFFQCSALA
jgi:hypothetical protein